MITRATLPLLHSCHTLQESNPQKLPLAIKELSNFRFSLVMENGVYPNYITEKILNGFMSGTIPIYHGPALVFEIFNRNAFVCVTVL